MLLRARESGSALMAVLVLIVVLLGLAVSQLGVSTVSAKVVDQSSQRAIALQNAEAAAAEALYNLRNESLSDGETGTLSGTVNGGTYSATVTEYQNNAQYRRILAVGTFGSTTREVEIIVKKALVHDIFFHAMYAGNRSDDPDYTMEFGDGSYWDEDWDWLETETESLFWGWYRTWALNIDIEALAEIDTDLNPDVVVGDIHSNGDIWLRGAAAVDGVISATGDIYMTGDTTQMGGDRYVEPPVFSDSYVENLSDAITVIDVGTALAGSLGSLPKHRSFTMHDYSDIYTCAGDNPAKILARATGANLGFASNAEGENYFLIDAYDTDGASNAQGQDIRFLSSGNNCVYYVDGNLWIESAVATAYLIPPSGEHLRVTFLVKGNIYICDEVVFMCNGVANNCDECAVAFVAISDGESYRDVDGDHEYSEGDVILDSDGDEDYEGRAEGSGNIYFGDPAYGGVSMVVGSKPSYPVNGFFYAENCFEDWNLDRDVDAGGEPQEIKIVGIMTAGDQLYMQRDFISYEEVPTGEYVLTDTSGYDATCTSGCSKLHFQLYYYSSSSRSSSSDAAASEANKRYHRSGSNPNYTYTLAVAGLLGASGVNCENEHSECSLTHYRKSSSCGHSYACTTTSHYQTATRTGSSTRYHKVGSNYIQTVRGNAGSSSVNCPNYNEECDSNHYKMSFYGDYTQVSSRVTTIDQYHEVLEEIEVPVHSPMEVIFDDRLATGSVTLPALPGQQSGDDWNGWAVQLWREIP